MHTHESRRPRGRSNPVPPRRVIEQAASVRYRIYFCVCASHRMVTLGPFSADAASAATLQRIQPSGRPSAEPSNASPERGQETAIPSARLRPRRADGLGASVPCAAPAREPSPRAASLAPTTISSQTEEEGYAKHSTTASPSHCARPGARLICPPCAQVPCPPACFHTCPACGMLFALRITAKYFFSLDTPFACCRMPHMFCNPCCATWREFKADGQHVMNTRFASALRQGYGPQISAPGPRSIHLVLWCRAWCPAMLGSTSCCAQPTLNFRLQSEIFQKTTRLRSGLSSVETATFMLYLISLRSYLTN